jgi:hypothetical protein
MATTNVPRAKITLQGVVAPAASAVLAGVWSDLNTAFGGDLNTTNLATPEGQLASSTTAIITDKNDQFRAYVAGVDPAYSAGRMQDGIARIYFISRDPARPTVVQGQCIGAAGTAIPFGVLARAADGNLYRCTTAGTIPEGGSVALPFACQATGPIPCPAGTLGVYQIISGWDAITNAADGVIGNNVESRVAFEARRRASVAINARDSLDSILANVLAVPDVLDAYAAQNDTAFSVIRGGITLPPHSLYVGVAGGDPDAVALAIRTRKSLGCDTVGSVTRMVPDAAYAAPQPTYATSFQVLAPTPVLFAIKLANDPNVPSDAPSQVQAAIINAFAGADGGLRARSGGTIYASRYYAPVSALGAWVQIVSITLGVGAATGYSTVMRIDQTPVVAPADITVALV